MHTHTHTHTYIHTYIDTCIPTYKHTHTHDFFIRHLYNDTVIKSADVLPNGRTFGEWRTWQDVRVTTIGCGSIYCTGPARARRW